MKYLYTSPLWEASQPTEQPSFGQQLSKQGLITNADSVVEQISTQAADVTLEGQYRWGERISTMLANELNELSDSGLSELPLYGTGGDFDDGYYAIETADPQALHPNRRDAWQYNLSLTKEGTQASHRRALETDRSQVDHPFGNDQAVEVGVPATASKVQWFDRAGGTVDPTLVETRSAELGDVEIYDATTAPFADPTIVYAIDYADEGPVDVRVWDERGEGSKTDDDGVLDWAKCFITGHDFAGEAIIDNGIVRLRFDEATPEFSVERWDSNAEEWTDQALGTSDWGLQDVDLREVGLASVHAVVEFGGGGDTVAVDCWVKRGWTDPLWGERSDAIPTGLEDLLAPVASAADYEPSESKGLIDRGEL